MGYSHLLCQAVCVTGTGCEKKKKKSGLDLAPSQTGNRQPVHRRPEVSNFNAKTKRKTNLTEANSIKMKIILPLK